MTVHFFARLRRLRDVLVVGLQRGRTAFRSRHAQRVLGVVFLLLVLHPGRFSCLHRLTIPADEIVHALDQPHPSSGSARRDFCTLDWPRLRTYRHDWAAAGAGAGDFSQRDFAQSLHIRPGGTWQPDTCVPRYHTRLIIPYRDRPDQLRRFLRLIHPFLQRQRLNYTVVLVEQADRRPFNRAKLFNVGYREALSASPRTAEDVDVEECLIFHDVDLIPLDGRNVYACTPQPRHMSANVDTFRFKLMYEELFGGAVAIRRGLFEKVDGFSNEYFGWGGEDDDFSQNRLKRHHIDIVRFDDVISSYKMLRHKRQEVKAGQSYAQVISKSAGLPQEDSLRVDGLTNLQYRLISNTKTPLFTHIKVDLL